MTKVYAVGLGPGGKEMMTEEAISAIEKSDVICGYTVYVDLITSMFPEKETFTTPMKKEIDRCKWALETAQSGKTVAMVCSGDSGVYGMAGLLLQLLHSYKDVEVEVVPGITAAISGAAVLGAPVGHDFCVISLSDLLTPWDLIVKRLELAAEGDFITCLYNPRSKKRIEHLTTACNIMLKHRSEDTVCGWVKNIGREGEEYRICTLKELDNEPIDMFTTVFIGSSQTKLVDGKMVTPRGYEKHEDMFV
ncbi:MAG: precorrin-3B C(17)-methyltransferase [[Eubacterium] sulci]|jgi:precorrin-3B C(17)-methyltransferase|nr:precorrin-3B C(17)-methyltransferase [[Eubacterium] sulci]MBF1147358.1 precorrin-3B C(17)-methyltransferase [[Eubacterium] sulci]MBF1168958.1 precorrin-3B C(17)-methyltransferase [[Eubacterium] sulci]MBF1170713.1 precorrin-3B C(17)-methyltransferase [[Eubacterium] sulci]MBF1180275.1 precorrin-3B C(17)-methyltransferase [[Eubacterium] sulci]